VIGLLAFALAVWVPILLLRPRLDRHALQDGAWWLGGCALAGMTASPSQGLVGAFPWTSTGLLMVPLLVVLQDLGGYWMHRLQHRIPMLWALHRTHHEPQDMRPSLAVRAHPVESCLEGFVGAALWAGVGGPLLALGYAQAVMVVNAFRHLDWPSWGQTSWQRELGRWLNNPRFHAWHHAADPRAVDRNFSMLFPVWDRLFGTAFEPDEAPESFGLV
jgi:sterol desaturase/sphingolipid hydroxylase (fatty acid hydroxylase superfamily)